MEEKRIFGKGVCFTKLFIIFLIGSLFGNYYEMILNLVRHYLKDGSIFWEVRRGLIYFPLSPVYGFGALFLVYFLKRYKKYPIIIFFLSILITGITEYITGYLMETIFNRTWWDYTGLFMNIEGYVCLRSVLNFAVLSILLIYLIEPL